MSLSADAIRGRLGDAAARLETLEVFTEMESTNSYLMQQAVPSAGMFRIAATDNQTAGRGRRGSIWQSPPGSGLCLSMAYTFAANPDNLPAMTLAVGLGVVHAVLSGRASKPLLLIVFYTAVIWKGTIAVPLVAALGVIERWAGFRRRLAATGPDLEDE